MKRILFAPLIMTFTFATVAHAETGIPATLTAVNDEFNAAAAAHDPERLVNLYANDTLWIAQGARVTQGLQGPRQLFEFVTQNKGEVTHTIDHLFVSDDETLAVMIGSVDAKIESQGMDATGTYLFVLEPEDDGWEIVTDMWHQHSE
ncbi:nuclear transport factor 2 family protein [uncultured Tateyamaria sp.]|uniref:YybH family protein n=1 Tax=uncultured Tateyamaria sp. TaxID=455651 RepID=UPI0026084905|nr:nuclear transport factor 2 family protein [uncultured Tateyamaria sp.]